MLNSRKCGVNVMRSEERQNYILKIAQEHGFVSIEAVAKTLDVSIETIRRDINKLCENESLRKTRGGAVPNKLICRKDVEYLSRIKSNQQVKLTIGSFAASMIHDGSVVALDAGVSIQSIAHRISGVKNVTFITNSIAIANILIDKFNAHEAEGRIIVVGGELDVSNRFSKGALATNFIRDYHFDIAFVSCTALSCDAVSSYSLDECSYSRQLIEQSSYSILIAESDKIGKNSVCSFAKISDFNEIITDNRNQISDDFKKKCEEKNTKLVILAC